MRFPCLLRTESNDFRRGHRTPRNFDAQQFRVARCIGRNAVRLVWGDEQCVVLIDHDVDVIEVNGRPALDDVEEEFPGVIECAERGFIARSEAGQ